MSHTMTGGTTIGILGGGAMSRLLGLAARDLDCRAELLDGKSPDIAAVDLVTAVTEDVPRDLLELAARGAPVRPGPVQVAITQERRLEREWLERAGFSVAPWRAADTREQLFAAVDEFGGGCYVKPRLRRRAELRPLLVTSRREAESAWLATRGVPVVVEAALDVVLELSVLVARGLDGEVAAYPPSLSVREHGRLACSLLPGPLPPQLAGKAEALGAYVARKLAIEGLLAVELFLLADGRLVVNELVPAPHPTFVGTEVACATGQMHQLVRAITGQPLGDTAVIHPTASLPIPAPASGARVTPERVGRALEIPGTHALLFGGAHQLGPGAPIGVLYAVGSSADDAVERASLAWARMRGSRRPASGRSGLAERLLALASPGAA